MNQPQSERAHRGQIHPDSLSIFEPKERDFIRVKNAHAGGIAEGDVMLNGLPIYKSDLLQPEFYEVSHWYNAKESSRPAWLSVWFIDGKYIAHPSVIKKRQSHKSL